MKKSFKKAMALFLCILMIFSSFSIGVYAIETPDTQITDIELNEENVEEVISTLEGVVEFLTKDSSAAEEISASIPEDSVAKLNDAIVFFNNTKNASPSTGTPVMTKDDAENLEEVSDILYIVSGFIGDSVSAAVFALLDRLFPSQIIESASIIRSIVVYFDENNAFEVAGDVINFVKNTDIFDAVKEFVGIIGDAVVNLFDLKGLTLETAGLVGYLYDPTEKCFYTSSDPWQRSFGYSQLYDLASPLVYILFDTVRFKFNYAGKDWMIQMWKGQYGAVFYGGEIGIYNKPADRFIDHYDCADDGDLLKMSMDFYQKDYHLFKAPTWEKLFSRPHVASWWCTGFVPGNMVGRFSELCLTATITMKDYGMLNAFTKSIEAQGMSYETNGLDVIVTFY